MRCSEKAPSAEMYPVVLGPLQLLLCKKLPSLVMAKLRFKSTRCEEHRGELRVQNIRRAKAELLLSQHCDHQSWERRRVFTGGGEGAGGGGLAARISSASEGPIITSQKFSPT